MKTFYNTLLNTLIANTTNSFIWFALIFWIYLETRSVIATSIIGASYFVLSSISGIFFGTFIDSHTKKMALHISTIATLILFLGASGWFHFVGVEKLILLSQPYFWVLVLLIMGGAVAGSLRMITLSTLVTILVPTERHDKANGLVGIVNGISFAITSVFSGLAIAYLGMGWALLIGTAITLLVGFHLITIHFEEEQPHPHAKKQVFDLQGSIQAVKEVPGLAGLIVFTMFNNFFGGVFMSLADAYGLELVSVELWGFIWGALSLVFIVGGMGVSKFGLTKKPLRLMFVATIITWISGMLFAIQASIILFIIGMIVYMLLIPAIEAAEQTVLQRVVPKEKQGRVFGFAQTAESLATPIMTLAIGPITQLFFIPFMTTGKGVDLIGDWFGVGVNRGIGLVFIFASFFGLVVTVLAMQTQSYRHLAKEYEKK